MRQDELSASKNVSASNANLLSCTSITTTAAVTMCSSDTVGSNALSPWNSVGMKQFAAIQSVGCASPGCDCKAFQPRVNAIRQCSECPHSWVFHACSKFQSLPPFFGNSLKSDPGLIIIMFETMSMALLGCHAIPTRIKILLDRIWSSSRLQVDLTHFLISFGWTLQDYTRGYMLTDHRGQLRDRWVTCRLEEEALIIQQFLRFLETRHLAHDMLATLEFEKPSSAQTTATTNITSASTTYPADYLLGPLPQSVASQQEAVPKRAATLSPSIPPMTTGPFSSASNSVTSEWSTRFVAAMAAAALTSKMPFPKLPMMPMPPMPPLPGAASWCGKGENGDMGGLAGLPFPPPHLPAFPISSMDDTDMSGGFEAFKTTDLKKKPLSGLFDISNEPFEGLSEGKIHKVDVIPGIDYAADLSSTSANSSTSNSGVKPPKNSRSTGNRKTVGSDKRQQQANASGVFSLSESKQDDKDALNGISGAHSTGAASSLSLTSRNKKRVLCTTCKKSFCDKGALKIHYSAVHLREMHKCTIKGCNMWFSSRRSRNRHSANPNPRLHMTHSGKKLPENATVVDDGTGHSLFQRSQMPSTVLNPPILSPFMKSAFPPPHQGLPKSTSDINAPASLSPSSSGPLNLSDPSHQFPSELCQNANFSSLSTSSSNGLRASRRPTTSVASSDDGGDEGVYIPYHRETEEEGEGEKTGSVNLLTSGGGSGSGQANHRSPATEFSASNLAQSSPSPPSSLHFGGSPQPPISLTFRSEENSSSSGMARGVYMT